MKIFILAVVFASVFFTYSETHSNKIVCNKINEDSQRLMSEVGNINNRLNNIERRFSGESTIFKTPLPEMVFPEKTPKIQENGYKANSNSVFAYITPSGKRYHRMSSCGGRNAFPVSSESEVGSRDPCGKCWR